MLLYGTGVKRALFPLVDRDINCVFSTRYLTTYYQPLYLYILQKINDVIKALMSMGVSTFSCWHTFNTLVALDHLNHGHMLSLWWKTVLYSTGSCYMQK